MLNPPITPIDLSGGYRDLSALLQILANPDQHKQMLSELMAAEAAAKERIDALNAMAGETRRLNSAAKAANIVSDNRKAALDAREAELDERAKRLEQSEARKSDAALQRRENVVAAKENAVEHREAAVAKREAEIEAKHAKIRSALS
jgi:hypothetical protein